MHPTSYDPNEDRSGELSSSEIAELETTLRSFRPREPNQAVHLPSPEPRPATRSRRTNPWTLGATWISGAIVGGLVVFLAGPSQQGLQPTPRHQETVKAVEAKQQSPIETTLVATTLAVEPDQSETIERLFADSWLNENHLSASSHLALKPTPKPKINRAATSAKPTTTQPPAPSPTQQHLLRELLRDPDSVL